MTSNTTRAKVYCIVERPNHKCLSVSVYNGWFSRSMKFLHFFELSKTILGNWNLKISKFLNSTFVRTNKNKIQERRKIRLDESNILEMFPPMLSHGTKSGQSR